MEQSLFLKALNCEKVPRPPVWFMRQAGRYLPEYRRLRQRYSFSKLIRTPSLAVEISLQPIRRFGLDACILFSDILVTAEAMGGKLIFDEKTGPHFLNPIKTREDIHRLTTQKISLKLSFVFETIKQLKKKLDPLGIPLIGFAGAPFTVASYLLEGQSNKGLLKTKSFLLNDSKSSVELLNKITRVTIEYLESQISAGVDAIQIFDSWADSLSWHGFKEFSLRYLLQIFKKIKNPKHIPIGVFCKGSGLFAPLLQQLPLNFISLDWNCDLLTLRKQIRPNLALQGNLDPVLLCTSKQVLGRETRKLMTAMKDKRGFVFNVGHGLLPQTKIENVTYLVKLIHSYAE